MADNTMKLALILSATDKMSRVIDQAVNKSTAKLKSLDTIVSRSAALTAGGAGITAIGIGIAKMGLDAAGEVESYKAVLKTMLGTTEAANKRFQEMSEFAEKTPFNLGGVVQMGNQLQAIGMYSKDAMTMVGDLAAASGKPLEQVIGAVAKMKSGQKGIAVDMFRDLLITTDDWVKATGKGVNKSGELLATTDEMLAVLPQIMAKKGFAGMMEDLNNTYFGKLSNYSDSVFRLKVAIGEVLLPTMNKLIPIVTKIVTVFQGFAEKNPRLIAGVIGITIAIGGLLTAFGLLGFAHAAYIKGSIAIRAISGLLSNQFMMLRLRMMYAGDSMIWLTIKQKALAMWTKIVTAAQWLWNAALTANPIGVIVMAVAAFIAGLVALWINLDKVSAKFAEWKKSTVYQIIATLNPLLRFVEVITDLMVYAKNLFNIFKDKGALGGIIEVGKAIIAFILKPIELMAKAFSYIPIIGDKIAIGKDAIVGFRDNLMANVGQLPSEKTEAKSVQSIKNESKAISKNVVSSNKSIKGETVVNYSPTVNIGAGAEKEGNAFKKMLGDHKRDLMRIIKGEQENNMRIAFK